MANFVIGPEWTWMWRGRPLRTHHLFGDICVLEYWKYSSLERPRSSVPTFHYDGIGFRIDAMQWHYIARCIEILDTALWGIPWDERNGPNYLRKYITPDLPRLRMRLWSQWYDPLPELFNATVDPWTKTYGIVA